MGTTIGYIGAIAAAIAIGVAGSGGSKLLSLAPGSLSFGSQDTASGPTAPQTVQLQNTGHATVHLSSASITGANAADFSLSNPCGNAIGGGSACPVMVTFDPSVVGSESASLTVSDDASGSPHSTALSGTGTTSGGGGANFSGTFDCYGSTPNCPTQSPQACSSTISSGLQTALNNAVGGNVICLNTGSYGAITLASKTYSSDVIVQPASNAAVTVGFVSIDAVAHLHWTGIGGGSATMSMAGSSVDGGSSCSANLTFDHITYTAAVDTKPTASCSHGMNLLWDHDRFDNLGTGAWEGRFNVQSLNTGPSTPNGITISNSHFGGQGSGADCSDGIDFLGDEDGAVVGPGNEFTGFAQNSPVACGAHVDPIQSVGEKKDGLVTGNYFHDNGDGTGGLESFANDDSLTVTNNVFVCTCLSPRSIAALSSHFWSISHNSFAGGGDVDFHTGSGTASANNTATNNAFDTGGFTPASGWGTSSFNLNSGASGTGDISGTVVWVPSPASGYYHYQLDPSSPGYHAGSDGKSMGVTP